MLIDEGFNRGLDTHETISTTIRRLQATSVHQRDTYPLESCAYLRAVVRRRRHRI